MKGDRMAKRSSLGGLMRKRLSDITNQSQPKLSTLKEKQQTEVAHSAEDLINQILMEKATLVKLVEERNKVIELSGIELRNLRINCQKLQLQNWHLAQSNSQLLAELNLGREKLKALQHELVGKDALLKSNRMEPEILDSSQKSRPGNRHVKGKSHVNCQNIGPLNGKKAEKCLPNTSDASKPSNRSRRRTARSKSMCPSTTNLQLSEKEKAENKRRCLRRQSARVRSQEKESEEHLFEIEDVKLSTQDSGLCVSSCAREENFGPRNEAPLRRAAAKVQSFKEVPLNVKMHGKE